MSIKISSSPTGIGSAITGGTINDVLYIDSSGNLAQNNAFTFISGTLSATTFSGSGSSLTGIPLTVSNADGTLTISPTTGAVVASIALGHANTWTGTQTFNTANQVTASATGLNPINSTGGAGGPSNGGSVGGTGAGYSFTTGAGGAANGSQGGGTGGTYTILGGNGGAGVGTTGANGGVGGGLTTTPGQGGNGGTGSSATNGGNAGAITFAGAKGGTGGSSSSNGTAGTGSTFAVTTGIGGTGASGGGLNAGAGGAGGALNLTGGAGGSGGANGSGNTNGAAGGNAGTFTWSTGAGGAGTSGAGSGSGGNGGNGGNFVLQCGAGGAAGAGATAGTRGVFTIQGAGGNIGLGVAAASVTARVHIAAGSATANTAPIQIISGPVETTARAGLIEYNGNWYATNVGLIRFPVGGTLFDNFADANNGTTVETDLYSNTTAANTLNANGDKIFATYAGTYAGAAASTQELRAYFGGTAIFDSGALAIGAVTDSWDLRITIIRDSSTTVRVSASYTSNFTTPASATFTKVTGLTLSATNILKITGQAGGVGGGSNQITASLGTVAFQPAA